MALAARITAFLSSALLLPADFKACLKDLFALFTLPRALFKSLFLLLATATARLFPLLEPPPRLADLLEPLFLREPLDLLDLLLDRDLLEPFFLEAIISALVLYVKIVIV